MRLERESEAKMKNERGGDPSKVMIRGYHCLRCGYEWKPRKKQVPVVCPGCMSPYWNRPREKGKKE